MSVLRFCVFAFSLSFTLSSLIFSSLPPVSLTHIETKDIKF